MQTTGRAPADTDTEFQRLMKRVKLGEHIEFNTDQCGNLYFEVFGDRVRVAYTRRSIIVADMGALVMAVDNTNRNHAAQFIRRIDSAGKMKGIQEDLMEDESKCSFYLYHFVPLSNCCFQQRL